MSRLFLLKAITALIVSATSFAGPLYVDPVNPRYFTDGTKLVFLTGSHTWLNLQDSTVYPAFDYEAYLNFLRTHNHNFIRLWNLDWSYGRLIDPPPGHYSPLPFSRVSGHGNSADGGLKFDLSLLNQNYFDRLRARVMAAGTRGIYVSIMLFDGWWIDGGSGREQEANWKNHFYNPANNVNGLSMGKSDVYTLNNSVWVALMEAYVRKVIDTVNDLDNVLYEISNETVVASKEWQYHMVKLIKSYEAGLAKQHPVGMTSFSYPSGAEATNVYLYASPADWISLAGQVNYLSAVPATNSSKVNILDSDHTWGIDPKGDDSPWVWKSLMRGHNPIYMDPYGYVSARPPDAGIRTAMGQALALANKIDLKRMVPSDATTSTGYALVHRDKEYLVYQPSSSSFRVNLPAQAFNYEWIDASSGQVISTGRVEATAGDNVFELPVRYRSPFKLLGKYRSGTLLHLVAPSESRSKVFREADESAGRLQASTYLGGSIEEVSRAIYRSVFPLVVTNGSDKPR